MKRSDIKHRPLADTATLAPETKASPVLSFRVDEVLVEPDRECQPPLKHPLTRYVEPQSWQLNAIAEGIADAEAGNLTDLKTLKANWVNRAKHHIDGQSEQ